MERGNIVELKYIIPDLHQAIQEIYYQGAIAFMNSCLLETIENAISRFASLEVCDLKSYESSDGPNIVYLKCPNQKKPLLDQYFNILEQISSCANNPEKTKVVDIEVSQAIKLSLG